MNLHERDTHITKVLKQINETQQQILEKMKEIKTSKKENPLLENVYQTNVNKAKEVKKNTVNALRILADYVSKLDVSDDDEKKRDLNHIMHEISKHK
jgi:hypothetical protein